MSLIVINYNGIDYLKECIASLLSTEYPFFEIILVDNGSMDRSMDSVRDLLKDSRVRVLRLRKNVGYAAACNLGSEIAVGSILAFLNNDIKVTPSWLLPLVQAFSSDERLGAAQPKLVLFENPDLLDAAGGFIDLFGCPHERRGYSSSISKPIEVFYAKGAAFLIASHLFTRLGKFDEDFFMYYDETDLCWRIWLAGYRVMCIPSSLVFHRRGISTRSWIREDPQGTVKLYLLNRLNRFRMLLKNYDKRYLFALLPILLLNQLKDIFALIILGSDIAAVSATITIMPRLLKEMPSIIRKRYAINRIKKVSNRELLGRMILPSNPIFFSHEFRGLKFTRKEKIAGALRSVSAGHLGV